MVTDGPIPFVPYMCGALAGTAFNEWIKRWARRVARGIDPDPSYGFGRLLLFTLAVLASVWLFVAHEGVFGFFTLVFSQFIIMPADNRRELLARARTSPMKPWQFVICLLPAILGSSCSDWCFSTTCVSPTSRQRCDRSGPVYGSGRRCCVTPRADSSW